ncbi:hypothetical protein KR222_004947 [Zaprionus bogoriensis]|nr:hypothetical protein KR222_004947 [Zaprionus bogoriensis]
MMMISQMPDALRTQTAFKCWQTWCCALVRTLKTQYDGSMDAFEAESSSVGGTWPSVRNRLARNMSLASSSRQSSLSFVERRPVKSNAYRARLPISTRHSPKTMAEVQRVSGGGYKPTLMPTSNVWAGLRVEPDNRHFNKFGLRQEAMQIPDIKLKGHTNIRPKIKSYRPLKQFVKAESIKPRPSVKPAVQTKPKAQRPKAEESARQREQWLSPAMPQTRLDAKKSTARIQRKAAPALGVSNWRINHPNSTARMALMLNYWGKMGSNPPDNKPPKKPKTKKELKPKASEAAKVKEELDEAERMKELERERDREREQEREREREREREQREQRERQLKPTIAAAAERELPEREQPERENLKMLLGDLLGEKNTQQPRQIEYVKISPTFKMIQHSPERRSSLNNKQFELQLENPTFFTHPLIGNKKLPPVQTRRTIVLGPQTTLVQKAKEELNKKLSLLLQASEEDHDDYDGDEVD